MHKTKEKNSFRRNTYKILMYENYSYETCINNIDLQNNIQYCISLKNNNTQGLLRKILEDHAQLVSQLSALMGSYSMTNRKDLPVALA